MGFDAQQLWLSVFLQAQFPSPFYFFDEVDCALDSAAVSRVASYVRSQCKGIQHLDTSAWSSGLSNGLCAAAVNPNFVFQGHDMAEEGGLAGAAAGEPIANEAGDAAATVSAAHRGLVPSQVAAAAGIAGNNMLVGQAQYILVSHKPAMFQSADCLLGIYSNGRGSSAAVVGHFAADE